MKVKESGEKIAVFIFCTIIVILILPCLILWMLWKIICCPVNYAIFKRSKYQKDHPQKFNFLSPPHPDSRIYGRIAESGLPIDYLTCPEDDALPGYFLYKDVLLLFNSPFFFDSEKKQWLFYPHNEEDDEDDDAEESTDDCLPPCEASAYCLEDIRARIPDREFNSVAYFYDSKNVKRLYGKEALEIMKRTDGITIYDKETLTPELKKLITQQDADDNKHERN